MIKFWCQGPGEFTSTNLDPLKLYSQKYFKILSQCYSCKKNWENIKILY